MPANPQDFHARALAASIHDGRLAVPDIASWDIFPFEADGLRTVELQPPVVPEPPRGGEGDRPCWVCEHANDNVVWRNEHWRLRTSGDPSGAPLVLLFDPVEHLDIGDLPDKQAAELGVLLVHVTRAVEALPHIARAHIYRLGDGGAHAHVWIFARPEGQLQLKGSCFVLWDDVLPPTPLAERDADAATVARALAASYGGTASA